jgi:hypothetical protein
MCESVASFTATFRNLRLHMGTLLDGPGVDEAVACFQGHRSEVRVG